MATLRKIAYSVVVHYGRMNGNLLWSRPLPPPSAASACLLQVQKDAQMMAISSTAIDNPSHDRINSSQEQSLLFLFDLETTGLDVYTESITEIAGKVFNPPVTVSDTSFSSLVHTKTYIPEIAIDAVRRITGITPFMLKDEEPLSIVLPRFLSWISNTTQEVTESTGIPHHPVLVAHNGNKYDFPLLLSEMKRTPELSTSFLIEQNISFADTLQFLRQVQNSGDGFLSGERLGLQSLYKLCFPGKMYKGHRALADVEVLEEILKFPELADVPLALPKRPASTVIESMTKQTSQTKRD